MGVAHGRIRPQQRLLLPNPGAEFFNAKFFELVAGADRQRRGIVNRWDLCRNSPCGAWRVFNTRLAVNDHLADVLQKLGGAISSRRELKQLRCLVNEPRSTVAGEKSLVIDEPY